MMSSVLDSAASISRLLANLAMGSASGSFRRVFCVMSSSDLVEATAFWQSRRLSG